MTTIAKISAVAGLAPTTVGEILRGKEGYNKDTCERVHRIARQLNYSPNYLGRALAGGSSMSLGVVMPSLGSPIEIRILRSIERTAASAGYVCFFVGSEPQEASETEIEQSAQRRRPDRFDEDEAVRHLPMRNQIQDLLDRRIDGLLITETTAPPPNVQSLLRRSKVPVVFINWAPVGEKRRIIVDRGAATKALARHLRELGHRRIVFCHHPFDQAHPERKLHIYRAVFEKEGIRFDASDAWRCDGGEPSDMFTYHTVHRNLAAGNIPTAILCVSDNSALGAIAAIRDFGLEVPRDVSVIGVDDVSVAQVARPKLTTIRRPGYTAGESAMRMLLKLVNDPGANVEPIHLDCELVIRDSTGPARTHDPIISMR